MYQHVKSIQSRALQLCREQCDRMPPGKGSREGAVEAGVGVGSIYAFKEQQVQDIAEEENEANLNMNQEVFKLQKITKK